MCTCINFFSACRYIAPTAIVKVRIGVQIGSERTSLCAPKVIQEVSFPICFCDAADDELFAKAARLSNHVLHALLPPPSTASQRYDLFLCGVRKVTVKRQIQNRIFGQFFTSLRKDSVANYASICSVFAVC